LSDRIGQAVGRLLGKEGQRLGFHRNRTPAGFDGFAECPKLTPEALDDEGRLSRVRRASGIGVWRRSSARARTLARSGQFAVEDKELDIVISFEGMYNLPKQGVAKALGRPVACYLGTGKDKPEPDLHGCSRLLQCPAGDHSGQVKRRRSPTAQLS